MTLKHFINEVVQLLQEHLGEHYIVETATTLKNNSVELSGVQIRHEKDNIFPTIYLEMLENMPYIPFMDLAITFHVIVSMDPPSLHSIKITNELLETWDITTQALFQIASENTPRLMPPRIVNIQDMLTENLALKAPESDLTNDEKTDMIVITNTLGVNGAAVILYPDMLASLAKEYDTDFYVIPSSIHEVILVSAEDDSMLAEYRLMVQDVNKRFVDPEEILSDQVYYYEQKLQKMK